MLQDKKESIELCNYLNKVFEDRISINVKKGYKDYYYITGFLDDVPISFEIDKRNEYVIMNFNYNDLVNLKEVILSVSTFLDRRNPNFKYNHKECDGNVVTTIEWNREIDNTIRRRKDVTYSSLYEFSDINALSESMDEREKRLGFTELSSVFFPNGNLDDLDMLFNMVDCYNEADCYLALNSLLSILLQLQIGKRDDYTFKECNIALGIILKKISSFLSVRYDEPIEAFYSDEYYDWSRKWRDYFNYENSCKYMELKLKEKENLEIDSTSEKFLKYKK